MPTVSVIVPCYNAAQFLASTLASVECQSFADWECILIDDCSTDNTADVLREFARKDMRFIPIFLDQNGGASAARNAGFAAARGMYITLLDADDAYVPDRLERLVELIGNTGADLVFDNQVIADFPETRQVDTAFHWLAQDSQKFTADDFFGESARFGRSINPGYMKPMFRAEFVHKHRLRYDLSFRSGQDYLLYADAFARAPLCYATAYCGYIYRRRLGSLSRSGGLHLRNHARLSTEILARYSKRLSKISIAALIRRRAYFQRGAELHDVRVLIADRRLIKAAVSLVRHPGAIVAGVAALRRSAIMRN
jgi:glycosyltransferase involved in cell wall biosynthesis